jgi:hypothetical protein
MLILKSASVYFALVFGSGFLLGCIRVPFLVPRFGERIAELMESPLMLVAIILSARWISRTFAGSARKLLVVGLLAVLLLLVAELVVGVMLGGLSAWEIFFNRDPVSGTVYYGLVGLFAIMPMIVRARGNNELA